MKQYLKLKGVIESDDSGKTWFVSRIVYLSGSDTEYGKKDFIDIPEEWKPCKLVMKTVQEKNRMKKEVKSSQKISVTCPHCALSFQIELVIISSTIEEKKNEKY